MTLCESAINSMQCHRVHSASAGRRPDSDSSPQGRSGGPTISRHIAAGAYRTRKPNDWMDAGRNICSRSTAAGPSTDRRDGTWRVTSIILAGRIRSPSGAKAASYSLPYAVSSRAKKSPSTTGGNIIGSLSKTAAAIARHAEPRRPNAEDEARRAKPGDLTDDSDPIAAVSSFSRCERSSSRVTSHPAAPLQTRQLTP
jgi:hypothetical protein